MQNIPRFSLIHEKTSRILKLKVFFVICLRVSLVIYGMKPWDLWDETNKSPLKMDGWQTIRLPFGARPIFSGFCC